MPAPELLSDQVRTRKASMASSHKSSDGGRATRSTRSSETMSSQKAEK